MKSHISVTATHPRSGRTRHAGRTYAIADHNGDEEMTAFDATQCVAAGMGDWVEPAGDRQAEPARDKPRTK